MSFGIETAELGSLVTFQGGGTPATNKQSYWGGDIPWVSPKDMKTDEVGSSEDTITPEALANSAASLIPKNSLLVVVRSGILARTVPVARTTRSLAINQDIKALVPGKQLNPEYLHYVLRAAESELLKKVTKGATVHRLSTDSLRTLQVPVPPLAEQQRIVSILDEAFEGIAVAMANAEKTRFESRRLLASYRDSIFAELRSSEIIVNLAEVGTLITGNTPPTSDPANYGYAIPFVKPGDFMPDGSLVYDNQALSEIGQAYARSVPSNSALMVCIGATIGKSGFTDRTITTNQQVNAVVPKRGVEGRFLYWQMTTSRFQKAVLANAGQATLPIISKSKWGGLGIVLPSHGKQNQVLVQLDAVAFEQRSLVDIYNRMLVALTELKQSMLARAFLGEFTATKRISAVILFPRIIAQITPIDLHAGILAIAYERHRVHGQQASFGHVKAEKIAHMVEAHVGVDLGRTPIKDAAGPNDFNHLKKVEHRARMAGYFDVQRTGHGYRFLARPGLDAAIVRTRERLAEYSDPVNEIIDLMRPMDTAQAEIVATLYAAWNNLLLEGLRPSDEEIVTEARENWHEAKLQIDRERFLKALPWMRAKALIPSGRGKKVMPKVAA